MTATEKVSTKISTCKVSRCVDCPFFGKLGVGSRGNIDAPFVFVGEAPGIDELRTGKPFTGMSGQFLDKIAKSVGIDLSEENAFITNALRCPQPKETKPADDKSAIIACHSRLMQEIKAYPRKLIVLMGSTALKSFTLNFSAKITRERGKVFDTDYGLAIATLHPAAILRNSKEFKTFYQDFKYISTLMHSGNNARRNPGTTNYCVLNVDNFEHFMAVLQNSLQESGFLSADVETTGFNAYKDHIMCLGIGYAKNSVLIVPREMLAQFLSFAQSQSNQSGQILDKLVWHNGKFDTKFLEQIGAYTPIKNDVMLMHYVTDERPGTHDLKSLAKGFLGADDYESEIRPYIQKDEETGYDTYKHIPEPVLFQYLANDCDMTYQLYLTFRDEMQSNVEYRKHYALLLRASNFLRHIENNGMYVDRKYTDRLGEEIFERLIKLESQIIDIADAFWDAELYAKEVGTKKVPSSFNPGSPKQLAWLLYSRYAMCLSVPKGMVENTAESTLAAISASTEYLGDSRLEIIDAILDYRGNRKTLSTYVEGIKFALSESTDGRIHPTFNLHTVETGRLSASNPNVQNFTRGSQIRNMIAAEPGNILIEADFSQAELRVLAWYSKDANLIHVYESGQDLHDVVAAEFYPGWNDLQDKDLKREQRVDAKSINFGIPYGKKAHSFAKERNMSIDQAQAYIDKWFGRFPDAKIFLQRCEQIGLRGGTIKTPMGRCRRFSYVDQKMASHIANEARNFPIQSLASDLTLLAAMDLQSILERYNAVIINIVHDSILIEMPDSIKVREVRELVEQAMRETPKRYIGNRVPFEADTKIGYSWGSMK